MRCCICDGTCNHVGPHSYCGAHWPSNTPRPIYHFLTTTNISKGIGESLDSIEGKDVHNLDALDGLTVVEDESL